MPWLHPTHLSEVFRIMTVNMLISKRGMYWNKGDFWKSVKKLAYAHCEQKEQIQKPYLLIYCYLNKLHF